jgi:hypothetical protein
MVLEVLEYNMENVLKEVMRFKGTEGETELRRFCNELREIIGDAPTIVELGSYMGESSLIFAEEFPNGKIYCIDSWEGGFDESDTCSQSNFIDVEHQFDLRMSSVNNITKIKGLSTSVGFECDLVYIDACHKYECVKNDIIHWLPFVKKIISGHDYNTEEFIKLHPHIAGVKKAVNELLNNPTNTYLDGSWYKKI